MAAIENTIMTTDITTTAREIDFVTRFGNNWKALQDVLSIMEPIKKEPGTQLRAYKATIELEDGDVDEGDEIPLSGGSVEPVYFKDITIEKYKKSVTLEDVAKYGADVAIQKTDEAFLNALQNKVMNAFYTFLLTGNLTASVTGFKTAIAKAIGKVKSKFESMNKDYSQVVVFVNTEDAYDYLGVADLTLQTLFGMQYVEGFLGADKLILSSKIPSGKVVATPVSNIDLYYIDPSDGQIGQLGLDYTVQGETNLVGFHAEGNYGRAVGDVYALMGMVLWAEFLDGIAVVTVTEPEPTPGD